LSFFLFVTSKNRIRVRPGVAYSLPVLLKVAAGSLTVCRKIGEPYEERIWAESQPKERFAFLCAIPRGKGVER
jgi:hypothetical protein